MRSQTIIIFLLLASFTAAQSYPFDASLYDAQHITVQVTTNSSITLTGSGAAQSLQATIYYIPEEAGTITADPTPDSINPLVFTWDGVGPGTYRFSYQTTVENSLLRPAIKQLIPYPFTSPAEVTAYLQPQEITDTNDIIRQKASELASGKTDSMEVVFSLAQWVQQNVKYDLTSVTSQASQKASWVMQHRIGVCDELTSLFMSMARDEGIPARFVSGIAYTNLPEFPDHWGPHGWAEVWLPATGWVPVDVTYGEIGYVDVTHISIAHSLDAKNTAIDYSLVADGLAMQTGGISTQARVLDKQGTNYVPLDLQLDALYSKAGSDSGDLLTVTVTNPLDAYIATDLYLATTVDTGVLDNRQQTLLLPPRSMRKASWRVTLPAFDPKYEYTIPFTVITQTAGNASTEVRGSAEYTKYPALPSAASEPASLAIQCDQPELLYVGETATVQCTSPGATICTDTCGTGTKTVEFTATATGAFPIMVQAKNGQAKGTTLLTFVVTSKPAPMIIATVPQAANFGDTVTLSFKIVTATLTDASVSVIAPHFIHNWNASSLDQKQYELRFPATYLDAGNNTLIISVEGKDKNGALVTKQSRVQTTLEASFWQQIELFFMHLLA